MSKNDVLKAIREAESESQNILDEAGKEKMVEILLGEENLNTYIVSHGWTHPLLSKIEVIKENEISRLDG